MPTENDYIYAAGFMDGEGTISLSKNGLITYKPHVGVSNTDESVMDWIRDTFGGIKDVLRKEKEHYRFSYRVYWNLTEGVTFVNNVKPYLKIKQRQADIYLFYYHRYCLPSVHKFILRKSKIHDNTEYFNELKIRKLLVDEIQRLNQEGNGDRYVQELY